MHVMISDRGKHKSEGRKVMLVSMEKEIATPIDAYTDHTNFQSLSWLETASTM
jgi:hypothetical protein